MTDAPKTPEAKETEKPQPDSPGSQPADRKTLDRIANKSAKRAGKTEQNYDRNHDIFTK